MENEYAHLSLEEKLEVRQFLNDELQKEMNVLKELYNKAIQENKKTFMYGDDEIVVDYAKYLLEYLQMLK